ncbi:conserved hypothetical protein [Neospora caninum Liverpool]|uniref:Uncharacterized protein n=1 Tax=Neospora caninum (strain Liverpool) TaxID=572307 RepID=F0VM52_NEOCL|nr:conserved hypothetical protein [Neospora caninum Liverpool]CBZ54330.1 conserved hypothetical protein [Neospora caninum Liverpool]CEL69035.1 TPA: hypothetical protein BN1204_047610 [Neospora caninum Liverpool]|eukprot:XP_003884361.1 conserved hypothetical protein [Neospora caninum Liverpool]
MGEPEEPLFPASAFQPPSPSQDSGNTAVQEAPAEPPAAALTFEEAKVRKRKEKMREFRKYLVDTHVVDALAKLLIALYEAEDRPARPQEYFVDYFGEYRDPVLDEIEELTKLKNELTSSNMQLLEKQEELRDAIVLVTQQRMRQKIWTAISREAERMTSLQVYQRLCDKKKPKTTLKAHTFNKSQFLRFLAVSTPQDWQTRILSALYPQGDNFECATGAPFKADPDNDLVSLFVEANNMYDTKATDV